MALPSEPVEEILMCDWHSNKSYLAVISHMCSLFIMSEFKVVLHCITLPYLTNCKCDRFLMFVIIFESKQLILSLRPRKQFVFWLAKFVASRGPCM